MPQKLLVGDKDTVLLIPAFEINGIPQMALPSTATALPISAPTTALLNYYIPATTPANAAARWGGNITCAVLDDWKLEMKDSSTKVVKTLCSIGNAAELTYYNYDAQLNVLRDIDPFDATSEFNLPLHLMNAPDVAYVIAHRIGFSRTAAAAIGQEWLFYYVWTDHAIPNVADGDYQSLGESFVTKGLINFKYILAA